MSQPYQTEQSEKGSMLRRVTNPPVFRGTAWRVSAASISLDIRSAALVIVRPRSRNKVCAARLLFQLSRVQVNRENLAANCAKCKYGAWLRSGRLRPTSMTCQRLFNTKLDIFLILRMPSRWHKPIANLGQVSLDGRTFRSHGN